MRSQLKRIYSAGLFIFLIQTSVACSTGNTGDYPRTASATGVVSYNGEPVIDGLVTFYPKGEGNPATGEVNENGEFTLTTYEKGDGAVPGQHVVTVAVFPPGAVPGMEAETGGGMLIPKKYNSPETSPLTAKIVEGPNELRLILED